MGNPQARLGRFCARIFALIALAFFISLTAPKATWAQSSNAAMLIADQIEVTSDRRLIARGNVEITQGTTRLRARSIRYNPETDRITMRGPIRIDEGNGQFILAEEADLSRDLRDGILLGARFILSEQLQIAAAQIRRSEGRYTQLYKAAATSCEICENDPRPPLWQIRAQRITHDQEQRQLYFEKAQLRVLDIPVFYLPRLRLPDPTLKRANGVLLPELRFNSRLGAGIKIPYFITLGPHRDLTLTPYLSTKTKTLEYRYRQAFTRGDIIFQGAFSRDDIQTVDTRAYIFGAGAFDLRRDFKLQFDLELTSDNAYLNEYGYSSKDRLDSELRLSRTRRDEYIQLSYINFRSLRDEDDNSVLPQNTIDAIYERRLFPNHIGGEFRIAARAHSHWRSSSDIFDRDLDGSADGRDVYRLGIDADWLRNHRLGALMIDTQIGLSADAFEVSEDNQYAGRYSQITPRAAVTLRYPMQRITQSGSRQILEPVLQIGYVGADGLSVPNEESTRVEFDEGNLLSLSRFPGPDRRERGWSAAYGVNWSQFSSKGWSASAHFGHVIRDESQPSFSESSGLSGRQSDFLLAGQLRFDNGLHIMGRAIFNDGFDTAKAEIRGGWRSERVTLNGSYIWVNDDLAEDRPDPLNEFTLASAFVLDRHWTLDFDWRYDFEQGRSAELGAGLTYRNECVRVNFGVTRDFTDSTTLEPATDLSLSIALEGFSTGGGGAAFRRSCKN